MQTRHQEKTRRGSQARRIRPWRGLAWAVLWQAGIVSCQPASSSPWHDASSDLSGLHQIAMIASYQRNDLQLLREYPSPTDGSVLLASFVLGLSSLEILRLHPSGSCDATIVAGPATDSCQRTPVAIDAVDINGDGTSEVVVLDSCGAWIVLPDGRGGYTSVDALQYFPAGLPGNYATSLSSPAGQLWMVTGNSRSACPSELGASADASVGAECVGPPEGEWVGTDAFSPFIVSPVNGASDGLIFQGYGSLFRYAFTSEQDASRGTGGPRLSLVDTLSLTAPQPPYVRPFAAFDHLQRMAVAGCSDSFLGVGMFDPSVGGIARHLQWIVPSLAGQYQQSELSTDFSVTTVGTVTTSDGGALIGMIGDASEGDASEGAVFSIGRALSSCEQPSVLDVWPAEFSWRTPDAPTYFHFGPTTGTRLLGLKGLSGEQDEYMFLSYDGYDLRLWSVALNVSQSTSVAATESRVHLHDTRSDLAFAN